VLLITSSIQEPQTNKEHPMLINPGHYPAAALADRRRQAEHATLTPHLARGRTGFSAPDRLSSRMRRAALRVSVVAAPFAYLFAETAGRGNP
jgi:hypothetical protein